MDNISRLTAKRQYAIHDWQDRQLTGSLNGFSSHVERLGYGGQLEGHSGCVNCLEWSADGSLLASGSDDLSAIIWDPFLRKTVVQMPTGHTGNIFSVKFVPFSDNCHLLSGAEDGEVRLHNLRHLETTQAWGCNHKRVKRIATSSHKPHLCWSAAEDGCIRQFDIREPHTCQGESAAGCRNVLIDLKRTSGKPSDTIQCKCVAVNPVRSEQIAVGALDAFVRLYDMRMLSLDRSSKEPSNVVSPGCIGYFTPGQISNPYSTSSKRGYNTLATTYIAFNSEGTELLANLSGEHIYLYRLDSLRAPLRYFSSFSVKKDPSECEPVYMSIPSYAPRCNTTASAKNARTCTHTHTHARDFAKFSSPHTHVERLLCLSEEANISEEVVRLKEHGNMLYKEKSWTASIQQYSAAIDLCPQWHVLYSNRALAYFNRKWDGDFYASLRDSETALSLKPTHKKSLQRRIYCLHKLERLEEAERFLNCYREAFPGEEGEEDTHWGKYEMELRRAVTEAIAFTACRNGFGRHRSTNLMDWEVSKQYGAYDYQQRFCGHCNTHTDIKEASFLGERGQYVAAGSDDGNVYVWHKESGNLVRMLAGDESIVNCIQWHPSAPLLASSGIENVVRLWEPKPPGTNGLSQPQERVVTGADMFKSSQENQKRMKVDPFEVMLRRMGFQIRMSANQEGGGGEEGAEAASIDPMACRQS